MEIHQRDIVKCVLAAVFMQLEAFHPKLGFMSVGGILTRAFPQVHNINTKKISCFFSSRPPFSLLSRSLRLPLSSDSPGLKSIMKKEGAADKQGNKRAKKNLKFVGVNGG